MYKQHSLTPSAYEVIVNQATEVPHIGEYNLTNAKGTYLCRQCGLGLFRDSHKFTSSCGWPSFDDELPNTIKRLPDPDGKRTEIRCNRCDGHLGHVFSGEYFTEKNLRHCVNSLSIDFVLDTEVLDSEEIIVGGGCFWGVQHLLNDELGIIKTEVGYMGGDLANPTYEQVCLSANQHIEVVRVVFDTSKTDLLTVLTTFFNIHHFEQSNNPSKRQYESALFYYQASQSEVIKAFFADTTSKGYSIATNVYEYVTFWPAEEYHQHYFLKHPEAPVCHAREDKL